MKWLHIARYCLRRCRVSLKSQSFNQKIFPNRQRFIMASSLLCGGLAVNYFMNNKFREKSILLTSLSASSSGDDNKSKSLKMNFVADAVEIAAPAVVHVEVLMKHGRHHFGRTVSSNGSGFIVTEDGMILTNQHVVDKASYVDIKLNSGETYKGVVVDVDEEKDLAAVKLINKNNIKFPHLQLGKSSEVRAGEWVAALGSPLKLSNTVTAGIVSSLHRPSGELGMDKDMVYIQTDAAINIGNSGGPLINLDGEVIGINCITVHQASGISFAIPSDTARDFLNEAIEKAKHFKEGDAVPSRRRRDDKFYIGISMLTLTPEIMQDLQHRNPTNFGNIKGGVYVARVNPGSPAERGGLMRGDIIIGINENTISKSKDIYNEVKKGDTIIVKVLRNGNIFYLNIEPEIVSRL